MIVNYIYTDGLKYSDIDFSCLSSAERLNELSIKGPGLYLYGSMVEDIITHTKQISKICFEKIEIRKINYFDNSRRLLSEKIKKSSNISEWCFKHVYGDGGMLSLPDDIKVLECRYTNCVSFKDYNYDKLEKLVLESVIFESKLFKFKSLKVLKIVGNVLGDSLQGKTVICPNLQILHLSKMHHIQRFRHFLTDELKVLHFGAIYGDEDEEKRWISQQKPQLIAKYYEERIELPYRKKCESSLNR